LQKSLLSQRKFKNKKIQRLTKIKSYNRSNPTKKLFLRGQLRRKFNENNTVDNASKDRTTGYNSTYKKLAVQWLNEALCFVSSFVVADSLVLRNRQLLVAANRYSQW